METFDRRIPFAVIRSCTNCERTVLVPFLDLDFCTGKLAAFLHSGHEEVKRIAYDKDFLFECCSENFGCVSLLSRVHADNDSSKRRHFDIAVLAFDAATARTHFRVRVSVALVANPLELFCAKHVNFYACVAWLFLFALAVNLHNLLCVGEVHEKHVATIAFANSVWHDGFCGALDGNDGVTAFEESFERHVDTVIFCSRFKACPTVPGTFFQKRSHADSTPSVVWTFKHVAKRVPRKCLETVAKADGVLCKNVCHASGLRVVHPDL